MQSLGDYSLRERIGQGSMGLVYRAIDTRNGREVALKTLRWTNAEEVYRLKREFRTLSDFRHPNLVRLYELVVTEDHCYFTMELVRGSEFPQAVRTGDDLPQAIDFPRLRDLLRQLTSALDALHAIGKLHRDIKPANVLVEPSGRLVLLDFGLAGGLKTNASRASQAGALVGTLAYMAPEQIRGEVLTAASDWYSVGVMLYETLTGELPFDERHVLDSLDQRAGALPGLLSRLDAPSDIVAIVSKLLEPRAARRLDSVHVERELAAWVADAPPNEAVRGTFENAPFIGRQSELERLLSSLTSSRREGMTIRLRGASGIGKSALLERFCSTAERDHGAMVLRGRCHPRESVPFKSVDAVVDDIARNLSLWPEGRLRSVLPSNAAALVRVFPVLGRLKMLADMAAASLAGAEPQEILRRAIESFRELVCAVADQQPVVVWIDDLQWGDLDSVEIIRALQRAVDRPKVLLVLSFRSEETAESPVLISCLEETRDSLHPGNPTLDLELNPLTPAEARELAEQILDTEESTLAEAVAKDSAGSPLFVAELARHWHSRIASRAVDVNGLDGLLRGRLDRLPPGARRILEVVAIAGRPLDEQLAARAAGVDDAVSALDALRNENLLRVAASGRGSQIATYHDRVREIAVGAISDSTRRRLHLDLAAALEESGQAEPLMLVDHYVLGEERERAAELACRSAKRAADALAFHQAIALYLRAIEFGPTIVPVWTLRMELAQNLVNAGYGERAAESYLAAAECLLHASGDPLEALRLKRCAAEQYLRSGKLDEGVRAMREVFDSLGLRYWKSFQGALASLLFHRLRHSIESRIPRRTASRNAPTKRRARMDALWSAGLGLSDFDAVRAFDLQIRHALLALREGDAAHSSRTISTHAVIYAMEGGPRKLERAERDRLEGQRLAILSGDLQVQAHSTLMSAGVSFFDHRYPEALAICERGVTFCRDRCIGTAWELANLEYLRAYSLAYMGEFGRLQVMLPEMMRRAQERSDHFALTMNRVGLLVLTWVAPDQPAEARRQLDAALAGSVPARTPWQFHLGVLANGHLDLYDGRPEAAVTRCEDSWRFLRARQMTRLQTIRIEHRAVHARALLACAAAERPSSPAASRAAARAESLARKIMKENTRFALPFGESVLGGVAALRDDFDAALHHYDRAAVSFESMSMSLHAEAVRRQRRRLSAMSANLPHSEESDMSRFGVVHADKFTQMLAPGPRLDDLGGVTEGATWSR